MLYILSEIYRIGTREDLHSYPRSYLVLEYEPNIDICEQPYIISVNVS